jgi:hypothetical protein
VHSRQPARAAVALVAVLTLVTLGLVGCSHAPALPEGLPCHAVAGAETFALDADQAADAATIAAVGSRLGLPDHAVTVALATALQESKLYNLPYGDQDSLGLFQQRPSQGWGTEAQILNPRYAATAFYTHLARVANWENLPVTEAAQAVQLSGAPDAYAQWEAEARVLAQALTGELPAAFSCRTAARTTARSTAGQAAAQTAALTAALTAELGTPAIGVPLTPARGWLVAGWLIAHADQYGVTSLTFGGQRWSGQTGIWKAHLPATDSVEVNR